MLRSVGKLSSKLICQPPPEVLKERGECDDDFEDPTERVDDITQGEESGSYPLSTTRGNNNNKATVARPHPQQPKSLDFSGPEWDQLVEGTMQKQQQRSPKAATSAASSFSTPRRNTPSTRRTPSFNKLLCYKEKRHHDNIDLWEVSRSNHAPMPSSLLIARENEDLFFIKRGRPQMTRSNGNEDYMMVVPGVPTTPMMMAIEDEESESSWSSSSSSSYSSASSRTISSVASRRSAISASDHTLDAIARLSSPYKYQPPPPQQKQDFSPQAAVHRPAPNARIQPRSSFLPGNENRRSCRDVIDPLGVELRLPVQYQPQQDEGHHGRKNIDSHYKFSARRTSPRDKNDNDGWIMDDVSSISSGSSNGCFDGY